MNGRPVAEVKVFGLIRDLLFVPKIRAAVTEAGGSFTNFREQDRLIQEISDNQCSLLVIDLHDKGVRLPELIAALSMRAPTLETIGYYSHVMHSVAQMGRDVGLHHPVPRSKIVAVVQEKVRSLRPEVES